MSSVQIEQQSYEMPPREGISIAHFLTVDDIERSARYYEKVFGAQPIPKYGEIRCYIRDPDGYIIEVGQSTDLTYG
jgi:catechol 2,3-dioxygenase-like lactoylglutathione lyase family enzyme